jgi:glycosyltransferase involved in cell wall biosynthesis
LVSSWSNGDFEKALEAENVPFVSLPLGFISKTFSWSAVRMTLDQLTKIAKLWSGYRKAVRRFKPDVVLHSNFHHLVLLWPILGGCNHVFHVHDCFPPTRFYRFFLKLLEKRVRLFVGTSQFVSTSLVSLGISKAKVAHVLNGVSGSAEQELSPRPLSARTNGKPVSIGIVGQVAEWKGHEVLVEALNLVKGHGVRFVCRIFGDGDPSYAAVLKDKVADLNLTSEIEWKGFVDETTSIYSLIDLCVVPSKAFETFGMTAAEASFYGIPVIATRRGALPEVIVDQETGYLVDVESAEQLAEKLELLISSDGLRATMGAAARRHALENLTTTRMVQSLRQSCLQFCSAYLNTKDIWH